METVVPSRYLPELLVAAPVWFIQGKRKTQRRRGGSSSTVRYFCDLGVTDRFAYLFQMYNNRQRLFTEFEGRDVMPLSIVELVGKVSNLFDYLVIATPYHDIASKEWQDTQWVRNMDPFLFGFLKQIPDFMFFLGRWSGTGLFPLMCDMIADTMGHIGKNKGLLANFSGNEFSWYKYDVPYYPAADFLGPRLRPSDDYKSDREIYNPTPHQREEWIMRNHSLIKFANKMLQHFECGTLFSWLRGERS